MSKAEPRAKVQGIVFALYAIEPGGEGPSYRLLSLCLQRGVPARHWALRSRRLPAVLDVTATRNGWCVRNNMTGAFSGQLIKEGQHHAITCHFS